MEPQAQHEPEPPRVISVQPPRSHLLVSMARKAMSRMGGVGALVSKERTTAARELGDDLKADPVTIFGVAKDTQTSPVERCSIWSQFGTERRWPVIVSYSVQYVMYCRLVMCMHYLPRYTLVSLQSNISYVPADLTQCSHLSARLVHLAQSLVSFVLLQHGFLPRIQRPLGITGADGGVTQAIERAEVRVMP